MTNPERVVFDCNIMLQALASPSGPAGRCVQLVFDGKAQLFLSPKVIEELRDVVSRPKVVRKLRLGDEQVRVFLEDMEAIATLIPTVPEAYRLVIS